MADGNGVTTTRGREVAGSEASYRSRWTWDEVKWASHCIDCYPGNCPLKVYMANGKVVREESAGSFPTVMEGVPDMNPMGCQKGMGWTRMLDSEERVLYPLRRVGERGEGRWERISWDEACTDVADAILDAAEEIGPEAILAPSGCNLGTLALAGRGKFMALCAGLTTDLNAEMNDFAAGHYLTWGTFDPVSSIDDWFHSGVFLIWFGNPAYTRIPHYHFITEARYRGCEVWTIAPDVSPSAVNADGHLPVRPGTDAALALAMCKVVIDEGLVDRDFVLEQTDLPLLVDPATNRYLRRSDLTAGGSEEQLIAWDAATAAPVDAPRGTLEWGEVTPALEGTFTIETLTGPRAVTTVFEQVKARLEEYTPERAAEICNLHADAIRDLACKIATRPTNILGSLNQASKHYHGDLIERSQILLLALTGNWGKHGTGMRAWGAGYFDGMMMFALKTQRGPENVAAILDLRDMTMDAALAADPTLTPKIFSIEAARGGLMGGQGMGFVPPVFLWYRFAGYQDAWERQEWHDPSMPRPFREYFDEAVESGWWRAVDYPRAEQPPRVLIECGGNVLRRTRGGSKMLLEHLWPLLRMVVTLEVKMSATAAHSDIVLPMSQQYEKIGFGIPSTHVMNLTFCDKAVEPPGECVDEWEAFRRIAEKVEERAKARGVDPFKAQTGQVFNAANMHAAYTANGVWTDPETIVDEMLRDTALVGTIPAEASLDNVREVGHYRWQTLGITPRALGQATDPSPDETFVPFRKHVENGEPYPTYSRRAQFLIDHPWFIEADEHLPCHKEPPAIGGDHPFQVSSGHNRWSIHSLNISNDLMLETHRGTAHLVINDEDAASLGLVDNDLVRVHNDCGEFRVPVKTSATARPGQVVMYNGFDNYQFPDWAGPNDAEPGMIKWLHLAGGYGHLSYWATQWQPCTTMRNTRVSIEKA
ncbi:MAG: molybdopterin-dependent oxidoreductase [Acidimicrobiia bacterium]|nr:molybdopterin-dependent oxidoreductase [Acidimicrobiia bacterium]